MRELLFELALRLVKPAGASILGLVVWLIATGPAGAQPSAELGILSWLVGAALVLLVAEGPI